ncbi:MAG: anaerobic ribonucleoside triphosphate reductase [Erysipelotrichaceae bacterium]|nr:anaerobic ribonucleoside triphosphate reductase [Erysipelotrichaceae bacterium]
MMKVCKQDGREVPFSSEKIAQSIYLASSHMSEKEREGIAFEQAESLAKKVVNHLEKQVPEAVVTSWEIQEVVGKILIENGYNRLWEAYMLCRKERSKIREMKSKLMQSIKEITFADVESKEGDIKRENANVDGHTAMGTMLQYGSAVSKEFCKDQLLKPKHAYLHDHGDIHIHDMDFMNMGTLTCCQIDLTKLFKNGFSTGHGHLREPQDISSYASLAAIVIQSNQNDQHGGQSIPAFDFDLASGVAKTFHREYKKYLCKHLELLSDIKVDKIEEMIHTIEKKCGKAKIEISDAWVEELNKMLVQNFSFTDEQIEKIIALTYKNAYQETNRKTYQAMEAFVHNLNTMHSRAGAQVPFSSINFGTDISPEGRMVSSNLLLAQEAGLGNGETPIFPILIFKVKEGVNYHPQDPNYDLFKLSCRVSAKRLFPNFSFLDAPFNKMYYKEGKPETEIAYMGCRTRVMGNICGEDVVTGRGNLSFTTINLPRLGIQYGPKMKKEFKEEIFFEALDEKIQDVVDQLLDRMHFQAKKQVKNFPFLMGQGIWRGSENLHTNDTIEEVIKQGTLTIGFIGLAECLKALIGKHHGESEEAQALGLKIIGHMRKRMDEAAEKYQLNFSLIATPAEGLSGRFTKIDKQIYGELEGITDREYYTNSFHIPVYYPIRAFDKLALEAPYHAFTNAGHISYIELDGDPSSNLEAFEQIVRCMKEVGIGYGSINHPIDRDPVCGYSGIISGDQCPQCGRKEEDSVYKFERIRRITGYLVGTTERFNDAKACEERDRVKHGESIASSKKATNR